MKEDLIPKQKCVKPGKLSERCTVSTGTDSKQTVNTREGIVSEQVVVENSRKVTISEDNSSVNKGFKSKYDWTEVVRKKPKRVVVVGNKLDKENKSINLQGIPKSVSLHVFRLAPDTTVDQVIEYLKPNFPEITCEALNSRQPEIYASFKINVNEANVNDIMNPDIWPTNACIRRFLYPRSKQERIS